MFSFRRRRPAKSKILAQKRSPRRSFRPFLEWLEERTLLQATPTPNYVVDQTAGTSSVPPSTAFTPQQILTAYGIDQLQGIIGTGTGQTIAIIDAYDNPNLPNSTDPNFSKGDLHHFDAQFGIPDPPSFTKLNQNGGTVLPGTDPAAPSNTSWAGQEALDVEWVHAIAPGANIILFEANSPNSLYTAAATAANTPGVSVVLMNFGQSEFSGQLNLDSTFTTPAGHTGVTFIASTGDTGSPGEYPAYSPNVLAVGGTSLTLNPDNTYNSESGWGNGSNSNILGGSGGGISQFEPEPQYQLGVQNTGARTIPDVSLDADPATGVAVLDSFDHSKATPWVQVGGTGVAGAVWAGLIAITDQGEAQLGNSSLDGPSQTLPDLYSLYQSKSADFNDITSGSNGAFSAGPGYDEVTGLGTPIANKLVLDLLGISANGVINIQSLTPPAGTTEGSPAGTFTLATFNDPNTNLTANDITATVTWGDGTKTVYNGSPSIVQLDSFGDYALVASHTFADEGNLVLSLQLRDTLGFVGNNSANVSVADASLTNNPVTVNGAINSGLSNVVVAEFTDANPLGHATDFTAAVTFTLSDGSTVAGSTFSVTAVGSTATSITYDVLASLNSTYTAQGTFPVTVSIVDDGGSSLSVSNNVVVGPQPLLPIPVTVTGVEGQGLSTQLVAEFTDTNPNNVIGDYSVAVNFTLSDGSQAAGTGVALVTVSTSSNGNTYAVYASLNNIYTEEGSFTVSSFFQATTDGATVTVNSPVQVADAPLIPIPQTINAQQTQPVSNVMVAEFTDTDPNGVLSDYSAQVTFDLGLGSEVTVSGTIVPVSGTTFGVVASSGAAYQGAGTLPITVVVQDAGGASVTVNSQANVASTPASVTGTHINQTEGANFTSSIGTFFHDTGTSSGGSVSIDWGDGNTSTGSVQQVSPGVFNLIGTHTYTEEGSYNITFTVTSSDGIVISGNSTAQVGDASLRMISVGLPGTVFQNQALNNIVVATFADNNPFGQQSDFSASISWGDGAVTGGSIRNNGNGTFSVLGSHTYANTGSMSLGVNVHDDGGASTGGSAGFSIGVPLFLGNANSPSSNLFSAFFNGNQLYEELLLLLLLDYYLGYFS